MGLMNMFVLKPSLARNSFCVLLLGICAIAAGTQTPAAASQQDEKGIATKTPAQAFQSGAAQAAKGERDIPAVTFYSAQPSDYFEAHDRSALYGQRLRSNNPERALFPGVMALSLTTAA